MITPADLALMRKDAAHRLRQTFAASDLEAFARAFLEWQAEHSVVFGLEEDLGWQQLVDQALNAVARTEEPTNV